MSSGAMGDPPYANLSRLERAYFSSSLNWISKLIIVGTNTDWLMRSRSTVSQKLCGLNFGIATWQTPKAGAANMNGSPRCEKSVQREDALRLLDKASSS